MTKTTSCVYIFLILITGCKKEHKNLPSPVKKQVIDAVSQKGIPFTAVYLLQNNKGASSAIGEKQVGYALTDSNGYFKYDSLALDNGKYDYYVRASSRYYYARGDVTYSADGSVLVYMDPKSYIKITIKDIPPKDVLDEISFSLINGPITEKDSNTSFYGVNYSNVNQTIASEIRRRNKPVEKIIDTVYFAPLDTIDYVIKY